MSNITTFTFESHDVRIIDQDGNQWFVLRDLLEAMGSKTRVTEAAESIVQGLGDGFVADVPILDNLGRKQKAIVIAESAATFLLSRSNTEQGRALNRLIHVEILPSIRKTGSYETPKKKRSLPHARTMDMIQQTAQLMMQILPDIDRRLLAVQTIECVAINTGVDVMPMQATFGNAAQEVPLLTVTQIGQDIGYSARALNTWLEKYQYITRADNGQWITTPLGESLGGKMVPYEAPNGHAGYRILWSKQAAHTIKELVDVAPQ